MKKRSPKWRVLPWAVALGLLLGAGVAFVRVRKPVAADPAKPKARPVMLANRRIEVGSDRSFPADHAAGQTPTVRGTRPYVVVCARSVDREVRSRLATAGAREIGYLPHGALLVEANGAALKKLAADACFAAAVEYEPRDKMQKGLLEDDRAARVAATVVLINAADLGAIRTFVADNGGRPIARAPSDDTSFAADMPRTLVEALARKGEVKWIERYVPFRAGNYWSAQKPCHAVASVWESPGLGLTGEGQVVGTLDTGIDTGELATLNADFSGRIAGIEALFDDCPTKDYNGHGTHTAGSIVGSGANSPDATKPVRGMAHGARLYVTCGGDTDGSADIWVSDPWTLFTIGYEYNICIHSDSWGGAQAGSPYINYCASLDAFVWSNPHFLPVMAAGNSGSGGAATCIDVPATSKNCLTVGAAGTAYNGQAGYSSRAGFSSYGPCADGRRKPDIMASGVSINSVSKNGGYQTMQGTSMATPLTAGAVAVVRQWLVRDRGFGDTWDKESVDPRPSAALLKAIVTGGAKDMFEEMRDGSVGGFAPNSRQGWGRLRLREAIAPTDGRGVEVYDRLAYSNGSETVFRIVTKEVGDLDVQLTWVDYPSQPGAAANLVNDLDLVLEREATGETWTPGDHVNNDEGLRLRHMAAGAYRIRVLGHDVPYDSEQGGAAALYVRGAFEPYTNVYDGAYGELPRAGDGEDIEGVAVIRGTVAAAGAVSFGNATKRYEFADGCDIAAPRFVLGNQARTSQHVVQTGGRVDITGGGKATSTTDGPVLLGHWPGTDRSYTQLGGAFHATNGVVRLGWDGGCALMIGGADTTARMTVKGLKAGGERSNAGSSLTVASNGVLAVGAEGLKVLTENIPVTLAGGTLAAYDDATVEVAGGIRLTAPATIEVAAGKTLVLKGAVEGDYLVEKRGAGRLVVTDASSVDRFSRVEGLLTGPVWTPPASPVTIDVLVAFEAGAKAYVEQDQRMTLARFARAQVAKMNGVLPNTELDKCFTFRYVGCTNVAVACTDIGTALYRSTYPDEYPEYQPIRDAREKRGADVVLVMIYPESATEGTAGGSYGLQSYETVAEHSEKAYSVVSVVAAVQQDTSVHEIAHLMGAGHPDKDDPGGQHWKPYSYGRYFSDADGYRWHTVMGYGTNGGQSYSAIPYFSSPEYACRGVPVGTLAHDNTRTLRETCVGVSQWREARTDAELAALDSPSVPVVLFDPGTSAKPATEDDWLVVGMSGAQSYAVEKNGVSISGSTGAKFWHNGTTASFARGAFADIRGRRWPTVEGEMLVSLGLRGTHETDLAGFFRTGVNVGSGAGSTITVAGLDVTKRYVLYYMTCDGTNSKTGSFRLKSGGYSGVPKIDYVKGSATGYAAASAGTAITASANVPLLVRVSDLWPNAQGKVLIDVGGATANVVALAEDVSAPTVFYLVRNVAK